MSLVTICRHQMRCVIGIIVWYTRGICHWLHSCLVQLWKVTVYQCFGFGSVSGSAGIRIDFDRLDPDPDPDPGGQKRPKKRKKLRNFMFLREVLF